MKYDVAKLEHEGGWVILTRGGGSALRPVFRGEGFARRCAEVLGNAGELLSRMTDDGKLVDDPGLEQVKSQVLQELPARLGFDPKRDCPELESRNGYCINCPHLVFEEAPEYRGSRVGRSSMACKAEGAERKFARHLRDK